MKWTITKEWDGQDAFILGGGPSLKGFEWSLLKGRNTIGCNSAYIHGPDVSKLCLFSDNDWFEVNHEDLLHYHSLGGRPVTHCEHVSQTLPWLLWLPRQMKYLRDDSTIYHGYGGNSGSAAIHLALQMGARRVFLLGFDGKLGDAGESNWHTRTIEPPNAKVYLKFNEAWEFIASTYQMVFPGAEIYNCNPNSTIKEFVKTDIGMVLEGWSGGYTEQQRSA